MDNQKALSMLGLARRAGALSTGHDAAVQSILKNKAQCILFCQDVSPRLIREFRVTVEKRRCMCPFVQMPFGMDVLEGAIGCRAGVLTVNDKNLAQRICELINQ